MFEGKVVLITGGTSGIGLATAELLAQKNALVAINGRDYNRGQQASKKIKQLTSNVVYIPGDVSNYSDCQEIVRQTVDRYGQIDIVVNSAGIYLERQAADMNEADLRNVMDTNFAGTYWISRFAIPELRKTMDGAIVNVASDAGLRGNLLCTAYCASKGAVVAYTKALALEMAPYNIRVNCVCPGDVATPMLEKQLFDTENPQQSLETMKNIYPMARIGTPEEVARVICFLASADASLVTGAIWSVDGGLTAM
jgi:Dehydrogenases with different specificities (related to short-chain alcohol dehydrogenases)